MRRSPRKRPRIKKRRPIKTKRRPRAGGVGFVTISTIPWSKVYLRGRLLGDTPLAKVRLPSGKHRLRFSNPQVGSVSHWVIVRSGLVTKVRLRLR